MAGAAPTIGRVAPGRAQVTAPLPRPEGVPPEVELARALSSPRSKVTAAGIWAARTLGLRETEFVN